MVSGTVKGIYISPQGGSVMKRVDEVKAIAESGLEGDRYANGKGHWAAGNPSQVTLISKEDLEAIERGSGVSMGDGQHRRNLIVEGLQLEGLAGKQFQVGGATLEYQRPRPPCQYLESLTEPGAMDALLKCGSIGARIVKSGLIRVNDEIKVLS